MESTALIMNNKDSSNIVVGKNLQLNAQKF